jgi:ABC-type transport system involved in multi-copper enzyme maturation permease subunit
MSTIQPAHAAMPTGSSAYPEAHGLFPTLFWKEVRESRRALVAGLVIFWLMPAMWTLVYSFIEARSIMGGAMAWILLVAAGWLYAVVVGAQTICRDWGRPEEQFLLSRPISARQAVQAKLWAGLLTVLLVVVAVSGWVLLVMTHGREYTEGIISLTDLAGMFAEWWLPVVLAMVISFLLAFTAGVLTRQMLGSVLLAIVVLLLWVVGPMLSTRLVFLHPAWMSESRRYEEVRPLGSFLWKTLLDPFWLVALIVVVGLVAVALAFAGSQSRISLGPKRLAWGIALVVLGLFAGAMGEVGNSLRVRDQAMLELPRGQVESLVQADGRFMVVGSNSGDVAFKKSLPVVAFRVDEEGRIRDLRRAWVPLPESTWSGWMKFLMDGQGRLVVTMGSLSANGSDRGVTRLVVDWPVGREPQIASKSVAELPPVENEKSLHLASWASTKDYAYLVYDLDYPGPDVSFWNRTERPHQLCVFAWEGVRQARLVKEIAVPSETRVRLLDGKLVIFRRTPMGKSGIRVEATAFDPEKPESLGDGRGWRWVSRDYSSVGPDQVARDWELRWMLASPADRVFVDYSNTAFGPAGRFVYISRPMGLEVQELNGQGQWTKVDRVSMSPLDYLFRAQTWPVLLTPNSLIEQADSTLFYYDISDSAHPRQVGFFRAWPSAVAATRRYLVIQEEDLVTVVDRPVPGEPGGPVQLYDRRNLAAMD